MFVRDNLQKLKIFTGDKLPTNKFLLMLSATVICPYALLVIGGHSSKTPWQSDLAWSLMVIAFLFIVSAASGLMMSRLKPGVAKDLSIAPNSR